MQRDQGAIVMFKEILGNNEIPALVDYEYDKTSVPAHIYMEFPIMKLWWAVHTR